MMKKTVERMAVLTAAAAIAVFLMLFVFAASESYAVTRYVTLDKGVSTDVTWDIDSSQANSDLITYFKIRPSKTGIVTFSMSNDNYSGYAFLCNASKTVISKGDSSGDWLWGGSSTAYLRKVMYGVKKGKTYFIKVKGYPSYDYDTGTYHSVVKWTNGAVKAAKSGSKKSKAKAIKRKKTIKGLIVGGDKKAKWYKLTTKKKNIKIYFKVPKTTGTIKITAYYKQYGNKGKTMSLNTSRSRGTTSSTGFTFTNIGKKKVTIYLKVQRDKKSSGNYTIRWK